MMKRLLFPAVLLCLSPALRAQESATPLPLPPPPWLREAPAFSQWLITFSAAEPGAKPPPTPKPGAAHPEAAAGRGRKSIVVTKTPGILTETVGLQNGSIIRRVCTPGLFLTQVNDSKEWFTSLGGGGAGFNDTDYVKTDFAGFDWILKKNYVGVQEMTKQQCFVFRDKVITTDQQELDLIRTSMEKLRDEWRTKQEKKKEQESVEPPSGGKKKSPVPSNSSSPTGADPEPPAFNLNDYKKETTAYIDIETGMPVVLTYKTAEGVTETRTYTFLPPPTDISTLPPEAQARLQSNKQHLKRQATAAAVP